MSNLPVKTYKAEFKSGFQAEMRITDAGAEIEWTPHIPTLSEHPNMEETYIAWRDECLRDYAQFAGINVIGVEL